MEKTVIEWLQEKISYTTPSGNIITYHGDMSNIFEQAKEMEKKQIIKFAETYEEYCHNSFTQNRYVQVKSAEQYYNETFKSE